MQNIPKHNNLCHKGRNHSITALPQDVTSALHKTLCY